MTIIPKHWLQAPPPRPSESNFNKVYPIFEPTLPNTPEREALVKYMMAKYAMTKSVPPPPPPIYKHEATPYVNKITSALAEFSRQLPFRLAHKIKTVRFGPEGAENPCFEVVFTDGKTITFNNIDEFPSAADVARVCVECP